MKGNKNGAEISEADEQNDQEYRRELKRFAPAEQAESAIPPPARPRPSPPPAPPVLKPAGQSSAAPPPSPPAPSPPPGQLANRPTPFAATPPPAPNLPPPGLRPLAARTDELTRIAGIDAETARQLAQMNYGTYRKIANLTATDITLVDTKLGSNGRVEREEWIRQATEILSGKPPMPPKPVTGDPQASSRAASQPFEQTRGAAAEATSKPFSGFAAPSLRAKKKEVATTSRFEARLDQISQAQPSGGEAAKPNPIALPEQQADMFPPPEPATPNAPAQTVPPAKAAEPLGVGATQPVTPDNLSLISGIGPTMANDLKGLGIISFQQLAGLSDEDAENVNQQTGFPGRVEREEWREQAKELMAGQAPRAKVDRDQLTAGEPEPEPAPVPEPVVPDDLAKISGIGPAIAKNLNEFGIFTYRQLVDLAEEQADRVNDHVGFPGRVQREEWREQAAELLAGKPPRAKVDRETKAKKPAVATKSKKKKLPAPAPKTAASPKAKIAPPPSPDDLTKIKGIGPALARELHNMGFHTFLQLSELNAEQIEQVNDQIGFPGRVQRENWIGQAKDFTG